MSALLDNGTVTAVHNRLSFESPRSFTCMSTVTARPLIRENGEAGNDLIGKVRRNIRVP